MINPVKVEEKVKEKPVASPASTSDSGVRKRKVVVKYQSMYVGSYTIKVKKLKESIQVELTAYQRGQKRLAKTFAEEKAQKLADEDLKEIDEVYFAAMDERMKPTSDEEIEEVVDAATGIEDEDEEEVSDSYSV